MLASWATTSANSRRRSRSTRSTRPPSAPPIAEPSSAPARSAARSLVANRAQRPQPHHFSNFHQASRGPAPPAARLPYGGAHWLGGTPSPGSPTQLPSGLIIGNRRSFPLPIISYILPLGLALNH